MKDWVTNIKGKAMKSRTKELLLFFVIPIVAISLAYTLLTVILPAQFNIWIGLLVSFSISSVIMAWSEISATRKDISNLKTYLTGQAAIYDTQSSIVGKADSLISNPELQLETLYIYKGYPHSEKHETKYFRNTVEAIEKERIERYYRIVSIRSPEEVFSAIEVLKVLSKSATVRQQTRFYASYLPSGNYMSFLVLGDSDGLISLPDLSDAPVRITGHRCGIHVKDKRVVQGLKDLFHEIRRQETTELIQIPAENALESQWDEMTKYLLTRSSNTKLLFENGIEETA